MVRRVLLLLLMAGAAFLATATISGCGFVGLCPQTSRVFTVSSRPTRSDSRTLPSSATLTATTMTRLYHSFRVYNLDSLTVEQLKDALRRRGLKATGKKDDLLTRLRSDIAKGDQDGRPGWMLNLDLEEEKKEEEEGRRERGEEEEEEMEKDNLVEKTLEDRLIAELAAEVRATTHQIKKRHVGWDGALEGYTLADGSYVGVKEDPRLNDKDRRDMEEAFRKEVLRWEADYPQQWAQLMSMCDEAAATKQAAIGVEAALKEREKDEEMEKRVREIERLEKERKLQTTIPMLGKIEAWEEARKQGAKEVLEIKPSKRRRRTAPSSTPSTSSSSFTSSSSSPDEKGGLKGGREEEEGEEEEEEEEEYVPIDAMYRDELDISAADGTNMRGYLVSSKMAQQFWRREERPVVLLLTDERGWRSVQMRKLADHMAFLTNHVFLVPDLYRGEVYGEDSTKEAWREAHPPIRLLQDARSAMACLVRNYNATATGIVGFGVGGGQALSAVASGYIKSHAVVAMSPSGYDAPKVAEALQATPTLVVFAGQDSEEAPLQDALTLMDGFASHKALPYMVRVFKDCHSHFLTRPKQGEEGPAEDAVMLATSWLEIQLRRGKAKMIRDSRIV
ncbi:alpha beta hydrolase [Nannochloropsis oceanica]